MIKPQNVWIWATTELASTIVPNLPPPQWIVDHSPLLDIVPINPIRQYLPQDYARMIFISANAVKYGLSHLRLNAPLPQDTPDVFLMGPSLQDSLTPYFSNCYYSTHGNDSEAFLSSQSWQAIADQRILLIKGEGGRKLLLHTLEGRGAQVDALIVYKQRTNEQALKELGRKMIEQPPDWIIATSRSILASFNKGCQQKWISPMLQSRVKQIPMLVHHWRIRDIAIKYGFTKLYTAKNFMTIPALLHEIAHYKENE